MWSRNFHIHVCLPFSNLWCGRSVVGLLPSQKWICFVPFQVHPRFYVRTDVLMLIMLDCLRVALQVNKLKRTKENSKGENLKTKQTEKAEKNHFFPGRLLWNIQHILLCKSFLYLPGQKTYADWVAVWKLHYLHACGTLNVSCVFYSRL